MKRKDINIRDSFVFVHDGKYYLYGTRGATCWGEADGFDCYVGTDLEQIEGPFVPHSDGAVTPKEWADTECYLRDWMESGIWPCICQMTVYWNGRSL